MSHERRLRILTYNIRHGTDVFGRDRLAAQAAVIRDTGADVVFLQEVDHGTHRTRQADQAAELAALSSLPHSVFRSNCRQAGGEFGNAILSRWPLAAVENHPIPPRPRQFSTRMREGRAVLEASIDCDGVPVRLLCAHFGFLPGEPLLGARLACGLLDRASGPLVFGGDLNEPLGASACHRLLRARLIDVARAVGRPAPSFPASWPRLRLDDLYARGLEVRDARVIATTASDHRPLLADLALSPSM